MKETAAVKTILLGLVALVVVAVAIVLILAAMKPDTFQVERSIAINAPPERIQPLIADFKAWGAWSPWEKKDPAMKRSFSGAESGVGARYAWEGDKNVGRGSMEIVEAAPSKIALKLDFIAPSRLITMPSSSCSLRARRRMSSGR